MENSFVPKVIIRICGLNGFNLEHFSFILRNKESTTRNSVNLF
jgi:hypothetical protein